MVFDGESGKYLLKKAKNLDKDQSYVLYFPTQEQLCPHPFPLGEFESKDEVRALAEQRGFVNAKSMTARIFALSKTSPTETLSSAMRG